MTRLVDPTEIEQIVGTGRHPTQHWARADSAKQTVYILHSYECKDSGRDLRECAYSQALDLGIDEKVWADWLDQPVALVIAGRLVPFEVAVDVITKAMADPS